LLHYIQDEENGSLLRHQGGLLYKAPLTATVFKDFSACYQHFTSQKSHDPEQPFVYVDSSGVRLVTNVIDENSTMDGIFALSMAQNGWVEMLAINEAS
jgi:hypothetical protein